MKNLEAKTGSAKNKKMEGEKAEEMAALVKEKEKKKKFVKKLVKFKNLPEYLQDNEFILDYYGCEWPLKESFLSVFSLHNEFLNIWTHLGGFLIFFGLTVMSCMETTELGAFITGFSRQQASGTMMMMMKSPDFNVSSNNHISRSLKLNPKMIVDEYILDDLEEQMQILDIKIQEFKDLFMKIKTEFSIQHITKLEKQIPSREINGLF